MKLIWHIVLKDFRRVWLSLSVWMVLLLSQVALLLKAEGLYEPNTSDYERLGYFAMTWRMIVIAVGFILAASLVMEDSLVATRAFWRTRPLGGMRLLAAKSMGAMLMFCVLPVLVLTPVWLWYGFSMREWTGAAGELALVQGECSVAAFALACITEKSGQFLVRMIGAVLLGPVLFGFILGGIGSNPDIATGLRESRFGLAMGLLMLIVLLLIAHQFVTRHLRRSFVLIGLGIIVLVAVRLAWPWDISDLFSSTAGQNGAPLPSVKFTQKQTVITPNQPRTGRSEIMVSGISANTPKNSFIWLRSAQARWLGTDEPLSAVNFHAENRSGRPPVNVLLQVAGSSAPAENNDWALSAVESTERLALACSQALKLEIKFQASLMKGHVMGELPLREGAEIRLGASRTRIVGIRRLGEKFLVTLEERDAWGKSTAGFYGGGDTPSLSSANNRWPAVDGFILRNSIVGYDQIPDVTDIGVLRINSIVTGRRTIVVTPPTRTRNGRTEEVPEWEKESMLVKVRFEPDSGFTRTIVTDPCASAR